MPGDTFEMKDKVIYVNGEPQAFTDHMQQRWRVFKTDPRVNLSASKLQQLGVEEMRHIPNRHRSSHHGIEKGNG